jgi:peptide/nickel transport system permease protein
MRRYLISRILQNLFIFLVFLTTVYFLIDAQPGDFGNIFLSDPRLTPDQRASIRANLGLDKPVITRFVLWFKNMVQGDFGISFSNYPRPVLDVIAERAPRTLLLFLSSTILAYYLGFFMGKILAWRRGGWVEYGSTIIGVSLYTVFLPWFALMMLWVFAYALKLFPIGKFIDPVTWRTAPVDANYVFLRLLVSIFFVGLVILVSYFISRRLDPKMRAPIFGAGIVVALGAAVLYWWSTGVSQYALDILHHLILPICTLGLVNFAGVMLLTRNSMLETLREDYIMASRAKGLPEKAIRDKHAARNAMLPVLTSFVLAIAFVLDGGVITESIFSWPGMGLTLLNAALVEDIPMVIGALVFTGTLALTGHLLVDILYAFLDPRIRYS